METSRKQVRAQGIALPILIAFTSFVWAGMTQTKTVDQKEFIVIGISARTSQIDIYVGVK